MRHVISHIAARLHMYEGDVEDSIFGGLLMMGLLTIGSAMEGFGFQGVVVFMTIGLIVGFISFLLFAKILDWFIGVLGG